MLFANLQLYVFFTLNYHNDLSDHMYSMCFPKMSCFQFPGQPDIYIYIDYRIIYEFMDHGEGSEMYPCTGQAVLSSTVIAAPWKVNMTQRLHVFARMVLNDLISPKCR